MVPQTREETHPVRGTKYSRIVGWVDENQLPLQPAAATQPSSDGDKSATDEPADAKAERQTAQPVERLFTGLRMYPEHDVTLQTTLGDIRLAMRPDHAPNTVWNFLELARGGFYRDIAFHRIVPLINGNPFVIQAGDPSGTGDGGPGYWLPIEDSHLEHDFGVISMARSDDPDSNGSQIFIALSRAGTARLDGQYCAFGYAVEGADTIKSIADVAIADTATGRPVDPPLIRNAMLIPAPPRTPGQGRPDQRVSQHATPPQTRPSGRIPR
jgi:peptidyl-prolyl cis-trans isomerase B (cyclophilin B)